MSKSAMARKSALPALMIVLIMAYILRATFPDFFRGLSDGLTDGLQGGDMRTAAQTHPK